MAVKKVAQILLCRCSKNKELFGITMEKRTRNDWEMMYSYPMDEERVAFEGFDKDTITASMYFSPKFVGCPYCRTLSFFQCGICNRINCNPKDNSSAYCAWCGEKMSFFTDQNKTTAVMGEE